MSFEHPTGDEIRAIARDLELERFVIVPMALNHAATELDTLHTREAALVAREARLKHAIRVAVRIAEDLADREMTPDDIDQLHSCRAAIDSTGGAS